MYDRENSDTFTDDESFKSEAPHFQPDPQDSSSHNPPTHLYNSFPVVQLSNGIYFPLVGTSLVNIEPTKIPIVVSNQLEAVDASSTDGGAVALIAIEGSSTNTNNGALVSRAISYFNKNRKAKDHSFMHRGLTLRGRSETQYDGNLDNQNSIENFNLSHKSNTLEIHIVTKISHAHLGYGRTQLALKESLTVLPHQSKLSNRLSPASEEVEVKIHFVLDSPRCYGESTFGNCDEEDNAVDSHIKQAGPSPNSNSWKESWEVLENAYLEGKVTSIGVSNFHIDELEALFEICQVKPHFYQGSIWSILFDEKLMKLLNQQEVVFHAFNINKGIIERSDLAPTAYNFLIETSGQLNLESGDAGTEDRKHQDRSVNRLILAWLVQRGVIVTPKVSSVEHFEANSPTSIASFPKIPNTLDLEIETAVKALVHGEDVHESYFQHKKYDNSQILSKTNEQSKEIGIIYNFVNPYDEPVALYRGYCETGDCNSEVNMAYDMIAVSKEIEPRETIRLVVYPGDEYMVYDMTGYELEKVTVSHDV